MIGGFLGKMLRVDLSKGEVHDEELDWGWAQAYLGGAGLAARYYYDEVPPGVDPYAPENKLYFMTGMLTGTPSASASRYSVVSKSPLTGLLGQANSGGSFGPALRASGYDGIVFEGNSPEPVYLQIINGQAQLFDARNLWGKTVSETQDLLHQVSPSHAIIASIGPAGENRVRYAAIMNNKHRAAGRCGMGAVMGAKKLKSIVCAGNHQAPLADEESFKIAARRQIDLLDESILKVGFDAFGTNMVSDMVNVRGGYPTMNWQHGVFEQIEEVNAQAVTDKVLIDGVSCFACPVSCGRKTEIRRGKWSGHHGEGPEYETTNTFGALCGVSDLNAITMANYRCNELGLDTISTGATIAFAMECYQNGLIDKEQISGLELRFGDPDLIVELVDKIACREGVGDLLAEGTRRISQTLGQGSDHYAVHVKGLELPAYDPRAAKICGLGYVTANRGGDHITAYVQGPTFIDMPFLIIEKSSIRDPFVADPTEARVLIDLENALGVMDAVGACKFMGVLLTAEEIVSLIVAATGLPYTVNDFRDSGERIYNLIRACCVREGVRREHDTLPARLMEDPLPEGPAKGMLIDQETLEGMKDTYYAMRGWDKASGIPTPSKLAELKLDFLIPDLWDIEAAHKRSSVLDGRI
jgi:aldehyde:ferredoxin oxidoreductase